MTPPIDETAKVNVWTVEVANEKEFCQLIRAIWQQSGLTLGQAKIKTGIRRSQIHGLTRAERSRLPRIRTQVDALVSICGLTPAEVQRVLTIWDRLRARPARR